MALENGNDLVMPVSPLYGGGNGNGNNWGSGWEGIIILFLIASMFGGFGNGFGGGFGGGTNGNGAFPWLMAGQAGINANTNAGFNNASVGAQLGDIQTSLTTGFSNAEVAGCNRAMDAMQTAYTNQIADLERSFASQTATSQGFATLSSQLAQCCCDNRLATAQTQALVQSENCADRQALSDGIRDIIASQTASTQRILDTLCQNQIEQKNDTIAQLRSELMFARGQASQDIQTARLLNDNLAQTNALEQYLAPVPRPAYIVQNPNCCAQNTCGCGAY